ncbi:MAG: hypothetical protein CVU09_15415 [Bacteroidetes bacterium HGW-Bacteroidetes-4]|jgi:hypothetical protein|nr:MAG: hypothetical protein CVU09_15415 [Bacteroidetes bacterium HGW-Bacteroidetes-4]
MPKPILNKFYFIILFVLASCVGLRQSGNNEISRFKGATKVVKPLQIKYNTRLEFNLKTYDIKGIIKTNEQNDIFIQGFSTLYGIEVFRAMLCNDSLIFIDKVNKRFYIGNISDFFHLNNLPIDACLLSDYIFGRSNCQSLYSTDQWLIDTTITNNLNQSVKALNKVTNSFVTRTSYQNGIIKSYSVGNGRIKIGFEYNLFVPRGNIFKEVLITYKNDSKPINLYFNEIKKIKNTSFDIKIPGSYKMMNSL